MRTTGRTASIAFPIAIGRRLPVLCCIRSLPAYLPTSVEDSIPRSLLRSVHCASRTTAQGSGARFLMLRAGNLAVPIDALAVRPARTVHTRQSYIVNARPGRTAGRSAQTAHRYWRRQARGRHRMVIYDKSWGGDLSNDKQPSEWMEDSDSAYGPHRCSRPPAVTARESSAEHSRC